VSADGGSRCPPNQIARSAYRGFQLTAGNRAGWPKEHGGFHALRHFIATTLITNHAEAKEVQRALRHGTLQITLETYVHSGRAGSVVAES
jgi:integrase